MVLPGARPIGVGLVGAGLVTQSIHLPTLARLSDDLRVVHVMDASIQVATEVAARAGAVASSSLATLLDDPAVEIVAVCSPHEFHAEQVVAACAAGKRAVFCEKPLAVTRDEAERIAEASARYGVPVVVGTMNLWDPAAVAALDACGPLRTNATLLRSTITIPPNEELIALATDPLDQGPRPPLTPPDLSPAEREHYLLRRTILALAVHGLAVVRQFMPIVGSVTFARTLQPWGYLLTLTHGDQAARLLGLLGVRWDPEWRFEAIGPESELRVAFPPSYVSAGSAVAELTGNGTSRSWRFPRSAFEEQWRHMVDLAREQAQPRIPVSEAVADLVYALDVVSAALASVPGSAERG